MTIIYRNTSLSDLTADEVDGNFSDLDGRVTTVENALPTLVSISFFAVTGDQFYVHMSDSSILGPYSLPAVSWNFRGIWQASTSYTKYDVFTINGSTYQVLITHTSAATFDPGATDGSAHDLYGLILTNPANTLPTGGIAGDVLKKVDGTDFNVAFAAPDDLDINLSGLDDVTIGSPVIGDVLKWNGASWANDANDQSPQPFNVSGSTFTPSIGYEFTYLRFTGVSGCAITIPTNADQAFVIGTEINLRVVTTAPVTVDGDTGVTVNIPDGFLAQGFGMHATMIIKKVATDEWDLGGLLLSV